MLKAHATVTTDKAARYLKALCSHFNHKVEATWSDNEGKSEGNVAFGFADCQIHADATTLTMHLQAEDAEGMARAKDVVGGHLERFAHKDKLVAVWKDEI